LAKLRDSEQLQQVIAQIEKHSKVPRKSTDIIGPVESDPEYQLIVEANNMAVKIDNEIGNYGRVPIYTASTEKSYSSYDTYIINSQ